MISMLILGYVSYGFLFAANSSFADTIQDSSQAAIIQTILLVISFYISLVIQLHYDEMIAETLKYLPFLSIFTNIVLTSMSKISWNEIVLIIFIQLFYTVLIGLFCSYRFKIGITNYGRKKPGTFIKRIFMKYKMIIRKREHISSQPID